MNRALLALLFAATASAPLLASAQEIGRLFFTPEQRSALDARRKARIPDKPAAVAVESPVTRINGVVRREGAHSTTWVNGEPVPQGSQPEGLRIAPKSRDAGRVVVNVGETNAQVDMKIGQSFDRSTGEVRDNLEGGEVRVNPRQRGGGK